MTKKMVVKHVESGKFYRATKSFKAKTQAEATVMDDTAAKREWFATVTRGTLEFINI